MKRKGPPDPREAAKRAALNALRRAKRAADKAGVELSQWEGEFLESVSQRVETYGRAFGDPDKGAPGTSLSVMQGVKLKEIAAKAAGKDRRRGRFAADRRKAAGSADGED
ncbi:MAG TPA: hypothetical protein VGM25_00940 [Caulobacteraceae bacterium]